MQEGLSKHFENMDAHNVSLFVNMRRRTIFDVKSLNQVYEVRLNSGIRAETMFWSVSSRFFSDEAVH